MKVSREPRPIQGWSRGWMTLSGGSTGTRAIWGLKGSVVTLPIWSWRWRAQPMKINLQGRLAGQADRVLISRHSNAKRYIEVGDGGMQGKRMCYWIKASSHWIWDREGYKGVTWFVRSANNGSGSVQTYSVCMNVWNNIQKEWLWGKRKWNLKGSLLSILMQHDDRSWGRTMNEWNCGRGVKL